jgi:hypothetical protein
MGPDCNTTVTALTVTVFAAAKNRSRNTQVKPGTKAHSGVTCRGRGWGQRAVLSSDCCAKKP